MKWIVLWDLWKRNKYFLAETKIKMLKSLINNSELDPSIRVKSVYLLNKKFKNSSKVKIVNWCIITGWAQSVLKTFWLSRMQFKDYAQPGIKWWNF